MAHQCDIRPATPDDAEALRDICVRTGDAGSDATHLIVDGSLYGAIYAVPYLHLAAEFAFVAESAESDASADHPVVGYVVGAIDTAAFEAECEARWWPSLRLQHPLPAAGTAIDRRLIGAIHEPFATDPRVLERYPSHLHINLLPVAQGLGVGRRLLDTLFTHLRDAGSIGVHLGVDPRNTRAIGFYEHIGMRRHDHDRGVLFTQSFRHP